MPKWRMPYESITIGIDAAEVAMMPRPTPIVVCMTGHLYSTYDLIVIIKNTKLFNKISLKLNQVLIIN